MDTPPQKTFNNNNDKHEFIFDVTPNAFIQKQMNTKAILSYLYYDNGTIKIDEISPKNRFGDFIDNNTDLRSNSMGKSMVSLVLGTAICEGYIDGLNSTMSDWPMMTDTLYYDKKLIDLVNMAAGDNHIINDFGMVKDSDWSTDTKSIQKNMNFFFC